MESLSKFLPIVFNFFVAIVGSLFAMLLGGHFKENGDLVLNSKVFWISFIFSVTLSILGGDFVVEHYDLVHRSEQYKRFIYFMVAVFGMLFVGTGYRAWQISVDGKKLSEIVSEIKAIIKAWIK